MDADSGDSTLPSRSLPTGVRPKLAPTRVALAAAWLAILISGCTRSPPRRDRQHVLSARRRRLDHVQGSRMWATALQ
ncbi:hypothetical protein XH94_25915 [Bradyrhizobium zhanjiangense]|uniref:Uncharacterized protein n=1 Tax=Bradyrhizobium zhanjiangense TaxID=1325107 RepID=A0A4Q0SB27_9BRAD|nr:hypothetical protein XH94_25915 [Bradyrhizobium zhanjiangense]